MKLVTRIVVNLLAPLTVIFLLWATAFYFFMNETILDEIDDQLEDYSEGIIRSALAGEELPSQTDGSNNTYYLREVDGAYVSLHERVEYTDENVYIESKGEHEPARVVHTIFQKADGSYWKLTVMTPSYERDEVAGTIVTASLFLLFFLIVTIFVVVVLVFMRSTRPLYGLLHWLDTYTIGRGRQSIDNPTAVTEFRQLNQAVENCINRMEAVYERERRFIGDASHELQTPLAICQNRLELLMENEQLTEEQLVELMKVQQTLADLSRLNKTLLFLSKIENNQFLEQTDVCINKLVHKYMEMYNEVFGVKKLTVTCHGQATCTLHANPELMAASVSNLLRNAYFHNREQGTVEVTLQVNGFSIANTGLPKALDHAQLFSRFYKGEGKKKGSSGLGLSIVKAVCEASHLTVSYRFEEEKHIFAIKK